MYNYLYNECLFPSIFCVRDWREKKLYYRLDSATFNKFFVDTTKIKLFDY